MTDTGGIRQVQHINFLSPLAYRLQIDKLKVFNHCITAVSLPWMQIGNTRQPTPMISIPVPGTHLNFGPMEVTFNVDEQLSSFIELFEWSLEIGKPDNFPQRQEMEIARSDGSITVLTSAKRPFLRFKLLDIIPTAIGELRFNSAENDNNPVTCTATFAIRKYVPEII